MKRDKALIQEYIFLCVRIVVASFVIINRQGTVSENQWITKDIQVPLKKPFYKNSTKADCRDVSLQSKKALSL